VSLDLVLLLWALCNNVSLHKARVASLGLGTMLYPTDGAQLLPGSSDMGFPAREAAWASSTQPPRRASAAACKQLGIAQQLK